jgi:hypothetical protein
METLRYNRGQTPRNFLRIFLIAGLAGGLLASCGSGQQTGTDSTLNSGMDTANAVPSDTGLMRDTAPGAEQPPGAINPGEDSARFGTGQGDSSRERRP